jgi:hypothetical protein
MMVNGHFAAAESNFVAILRLLLDMKGLESQGRVVDAPKSASPPVSSTETSSWYISTLTPVKRLFQPNRLRDPNGRESHLLHTCKDHRNCVRKSTVDEDVPLRRRDQIGGKIAGPHPIDISSSETSAKKVEVFWSGAKHRVFLRRHLCLSF